MSGSHRSRSSGANRRSLAASRTTAGHRSRRAQHVPEQRISKIQIDGSVLTPDQLKASIPSQSSGLITSQHNSEPLKIKARPLTEEMIASLTQCGVISSKNDTTYSKFPNLSTKKRADTTVKTYEIYSNMFHKHCIGK